MCKCGQTSCRCGDKRTHGAESACGCSHRHSCGSDMVKPCGCDHGHMCGNKQ